MNKQTYILFHSDSPICQDSIQSLPPDYHNNLKIHDVATEPHEEMHEHVAMTVRSQRNFKTEQPNRTVTPTVMFYDHGTQSYLKKEGVEAIKFIHNFSTQKKALALKQMSVTHSENMGTMQNTSSNLKRILDLEVKRTAIKKQIQPPNQQSTFRNIVESNHKLQLQQMYNKMHNEIHRKVQGHGEK